MKKKTGIKMNPKKKKWIILGNIAGVIILFIVVSKVFAGNAAMPVTVIQPVYGDIEATIGTSGTVESEKTKVYFSPVAGKVSDIAVTAGETVQEGDVLLSYDMSDFEIQLKQAELQKQASNSSYQSVMAENNEQMGKLAEANTNLDVLNQQIADEKAYIKSLQDSLTSLQNKIANDIATESYNLTVEANNLSTVSGNDSKMQELKNAQAANAYKSQVAGINANVVELQKKISEEQEKLQGYETYKTEMQSQKGSSEGVVLDNSKKMEYQANNELANITGELAKADYDAANTGVKAEFDGIVTEVTAVPGASLSAGMQLFTVASNKDVRVSITVSKYDLESIAVGQKVDVTIAGKEYQGTVSQINKMATLNANGNPVVGAQIHIEDADEDIYLGIEAKVVIHTESANQVLIVPVEVVNADKEGDFVYVVENGVVVRKNIVTGISSDSYIEIKEGLNEEDIVLSNISTGIVEGMAVTPVMN